MFVYHAFLASIGLRTRIGAVGNRILWAELARKVSGLGLAHPDLKARCYPNMDPEENYCPSKGGLLSAAYEVWASVSPTQLQT